MQETLRLVPFPFHPRSFFRAVSYIQLKKSTGQKKRDFFYEFTGCSLTSYAFHGSRRSAEHLALIPEKNSEEKNLSKFWRSGIRTFAREIEYIPNMYLLYKLVAGECGYLKPAVCGCSLRRLHLVNLSSDHFLMLDHSPRSTVSYSL